MIHTYLFFHLDSLILIFYKWNLFRLLQLLEDQNCNLTIESVEKEALLFYTLQAIIGHFYPFFFFLFFNPYFWYEMTSRRFKANPIGAPLSFLEQ